MAEVLTVNDLLDGHVALDLQCMDRIYLNGYVPSLQVGGQVVSFMTQHLGLPIPPPAVVEKIGTRFRRGHGLLEESQLQGVVLKPHRVAKSKMPSELKRAVRLQSTRVAGAGGVIVLVDADGDDPVFPASTLQATLSSDLADSTHVVIAVKEHEAWFLAGIESLRSHRSMRSNAHFDGDPEAPCDAKGRFRDQMTEAYQETIHQVAFSSLVDLAAMEARSPGFRQLKTLRKEHRGRMVVGGLIKSVVTGAVRR